MTVTYSLNVASARFCGFTKLLFRWKGSIYKIIWKEFLIFVIAYSLVSLTYRFLFNDHQRLMFEKIVLTIDSVIDMIPVSFVLGFYVNQVFTRWWQQFLAIPWPDRLCHKIATYVHGADERSRIMRRTLGRYLILLQGLTFQAVSTAIKKRFPTTQHLVTAGIMTEEEKAIYDETDGTYGKWWLPAQWFSALAKKARKEGRIKDSLQLDSINNEFLNFRESCKVMFFYDWISIPLVYTQVVTLATYMYVISLLLGRQYLDPKKGYPKHETDLYIPIFTLMQFLFYVGWLKVAEQLVNPYGEDDDDFELNWSLDRSCQVVFFLVDPYEMKPPKLRRDIFWDDLLPVLPQTKHSIVNNPQLGSAFKLEVDPADSEFLPMDILLEEGKKVNAHVTDNQGVKLQYRHSSFVNKLLQSNVRKRSTQLNSSLRGQTNSGFKIYNNDIPIQTPRRNTLNCTRCFENSQKHRSNVNRRISSISTRLYNIDNNLTCNLHAKAYPYRICENNTGYKYISKTQVLSNLEDNVSSQADHDLSEKKQNMLSGMCMPSTSDNQCILTHRVTDSSAISNFGSIKISDQVELDKVANPEQNRKSYESCCSLSTTSESCSDEDEDAQEFTEANEIRDVSKEESTIVVFHEANGIEEPIKEEQSL